MINDKRDEEYNDEDDEFSDLIEDKGNGRDNFIRQDDHYVGDGHDDPKKRYIRFIDDDDRFRSYQDREDY